MHDYRHLEAYRLARSLLAEVCAAGTAGTDPLRHAAASAAARILDGSTREDDEAFREALTAAATALEALADQIPRCRRSGVLDPGTARHLLERQTAAAAALDVLISRTAPHRPATTAPGPA